jgi:phospholipase C
LEVFVRKLHALAALALLTLLAACNTSSQQQGTGGTMPASNLQIADSSGAIKHIVILFQENRSFNSMFMGFPGADTRRFGACRRYKPPGSKHVYCPDDRPVKLHKVLLESSCYPGCNGGADIAHQYNTFLTESDKDPKTGVLRMDRFNAIEWGTNGGGPPAGLFPYAYVDPAETKSYWDMASAYGLADHMFSSEKSDSFPAHQELIAGTTALNDQESLVDSPSVPFWGCDAPAGTYTPVLLKDGRYRLKGPFPCFNQYKTIADVLDAANVPWHYYVQAMFGKYEDFSGRTWNGFDVIKSVRYHSDWKNVIHPNYRVLQDAADGTLPSVSWVIPTLHDSDHPAAACPNGPSWVTRVVDAIGKGPQWKSTAILITWDEWGGWYDGVPPPQLDYTTLGIRVPLIVISPYVRKHYVSKTQYEFGSLLKFIEQTFGTASLGTTDVRANSVSDMFDFTQQPSAFTPFPIPSPKPCNKVSDQQLIEEEGGAPG